jgi:glutathione-regulated potassium-efflux system ancillary protein KefF
MQKPDILILAAHPDLHLSRVNRALMEAAATLPHVRVHDLYARYPDYLIDVPAEQRLAAACDLVVWLHPMHWYGMPPLMKLWLDEVLTRDWAYGRAGRQLEGKDVWLVTSTGGTDAAYTPHGYNRHTFDAFLPPYRQTAALCGMRFLPPLVLHGAHRADDAAIRNHVAHWVDRLEHYPDWPELAGLADCPECTVPPDDRPAEV